MTQAQKDIFVILDTSRQGCFKDADGFISRNDYQHHGISCISDYEWGCFKQGNTNLRVILCSGLSMTVQQFCELWSIIYPTCDKIVKKEHS